ncbi:SRPBCC domain-containing protein, partial [Streptomyces viridochromogenes]
MEHEVFVPVPAERLREVLDDPARVARAVPGLQQDAGAEPVAGRLKIRVGSHSVTYRGTARVSRRDDGAYSVEGEAEESRGSGSVTLALRISLREAEGGATVVFEGTAAADGRIEGLPADQVEGAVTRLLNRFVEHLAEAAPETTTSLATQDYEPRATTNHETTPDADDEAPPPPPPPLDEAQGSGPDEGASATASGDGAQGSGSGDGAAASGAGGEGAAAASGGEARASGPGDGSSTPGPGDKTAAAAEDGAQASGDETPATPDNEPPTPGPDNEPPAPGPDNRAPRPRRRAPGPR